MQRQLTTTMSQLNRTTSATEALKNAEALFESKNIGEIREVQARTNGDIDDKKRQLRRLVGDSYRDLIEGADKIVAIAKTCDTILANVTNVQGAFSKLTGGITTTTWSTGEKKEFLKRHEELYAVGSRVKYLVDTPEMIWGCLDAQSYLAAARRYLRAQEVHRLLRTSFSSDLLARFPLLSHQWPQVLKFKQQILAAVNSSLAGSTVPPVAQVADALAAAAALESLDSAATLQLLLRSRSAMMEQMLGAAGGREEQTVEGAAQLLSSWAGVMQQSITQVAELFLEKGGEAEGGTALMRALRQADQQESSGLFYTPSGGAVENGGEGGGAQISAEAAAWLACQREIEGRLLPQASGQVEHSCSSWVAQLAQGLLPRAAQLLSSCQEAAQLCQVERVLRASIAAWSKSGQPRAAAGLLEGRGPREGGADSWEGVCEWVLGRPLNAWAEVFHAPLLQRSKEIVEARFTAAREAVEAPIEACLQEAATAPLEPAGRVLCTAWPQFGAVSELLSAGSGGLLASAPSIPAGHHLPPEAAFTGGQPAAPISVYRQQVQVIRQQLDAHLASTLACCLELLDTPTPTAAPGGAPLDTFQGLSSSYGGGAGMAGLLLHHASMGAAGLQGWAGGASARDSSGRAAELEPFIQQQAAQMAASLATLLQSRFDSLPTPDPTDPQSSRTIEQMLLVARLCLALSADSRGLQLLLGSPDAWRPQAAVSALMPQQHSSLGGRGGKAQHRSPRLQALAATFSATANSAFRHWAQWGAASLAQQLRAGLQRDEVLRLQTAVPQSWSLTILSAQGEPDGLEEGPGEMRFSLPACPSVAVFALLDCACQETRRAGGNTLGVEALQVLEWELLGEALQVLKSLLEEGSAFSEGLSEKGVLQLLFDLRFMRDVLAGGRPLIPRPDSAAVPANTNMYLPEVIDPAVTAAVAERRRQCAALEAVLQERLDPIDWATYEPYLWANVEKYYHRCAVLLGTLVQLQRSYSEAAGKVQPSQELNPLNLLPVASRFQYLPISAPTLLNLQAHAPRTASAQLFNKLGAYSPSMDESYSFANLGHVKDAASAAASASLADDGGNSAASTLGALQARLQAGSFGTLGSMLGDKAAEMTAMAQQRFETMSLDLSGGLLSSFAKGVVRAPVQVAK